MGFTSEFRVLLKTLIKTAAQRDLISEDFRRICEYLHISKMYYDINLEYHDRYRGRLAGKMEISENERLGKITLFDSGGATEQKITYTYDYGGGDTVYTSIEFPAGMVVGEDKQRIYNFMSDIMFLIVSRQNMRARLMFAEIMDAQTNIPNSVFLKKKFSRAVKEHPEMKFDVLYINLRNFKYINEVGGAKSGDEAIIRYAQTLMGFVDDDECVCRMGGDNFVMYVKQEHTREVTDRLKNISIGQLQSVPGRSFEISAWIGISEYNSGEQLPFGARLEQASIACSIGKGRLKKSQVAFTEDLMQLVRKGRDIIAMFRPAVENREFHPFFQAKVDMRTGELVGFEALCRWIHEEGFIYPDQFIPVLDKEGLIHELDMTIFRETCLAIKSWKEMGLKPPRISSNFSRKNLFIPGIEKKIHDTILETGIDESDVEIEITESVKDFEADRLIEFVAALKGYGIHIAVDDFGTGYSSLSLIHNIDADILKIDKSFVDALPNDRRSEILIGSIINIANNLNMEVIAEGVERAEQGKVLTRLGCCHAQGYYYSKPVDYDTATKLIKDPPFKPIE